MDMEIAPQEERNHKDHQAQIMKGKRTKRPRIVLPSLTLAMTSSSSSGGQSGGAMVSPTTSKKLSPISTEEDQDMANCLMLLARGKTRKSPEPVVVPTNKGGLDVYQCKTCNKCFPSFQALGGHRTSHRKPKPNTEELQKKDTSMMLEEYRDNGFNTPNTAFSLHMVSRAIPISVVKAKVHECAICGAEFSSGQALGGHMRRHRSYAGTSLSTISTSSISEIPVAKKQRNILQLDLNLPAPEDENNNNNNNNRGFSYSSKEQALVFSASPLVDCHY